MGCFSSIKSILDINLLCVFHYMEFQWERKWNKEFILCIVTNCTRRSTVTFLRVTTICITSGAGKNAVIKRKKLILFWEYKRERGCRFQFWAQTLNEVTGEIDEKKLMKIQVGCFSNSEFLVKPLASKKNKTTTKNKIEQNKTKMGLKRRLD